MDQGLGLGPGPRPGPWAGPWPWARPGPALNTAHVLRLNKADVLALNKAQSLFGQVLFLGKIKACLACNKPNLKTKSLLK